MQWMQHLHARRKIIAEQVVRHRYIGITLSSMENVNVQPWVVRGTPIYRRISLAMFLAGFTTFSLLYCVQPLFMEFTKEFHITPTQSSLSLSVSTAILAFSILCFGALSERLGRRGLMCASMALAAFFNICTSFTHSWDALVMMRALEGLALGAVPAVAMAYLAEEIEPESLGFSMGLYVGGTALGGMIGRISMSLMSDIFAWHTAMLIMGVLNLIIAGLFFILLPPSRHFVARAHLGFSYHWQQWKSHLMNPQLPPAFIIGCCVMGIFVTIYNYAGFLLMAPPFNLSATLTGLIFGAYIFGVFSSSIAGNLSYKYGRTTTMVIGIVTMIVGVLLSLSSSLFVLIAGIVCVTFGFFMSHSAASSWVGRLAQGAKGHASSLYLLAYYIGSSVLGSSGGWFWEHGGWSSIALFSVVVLLVGLVMVVLLQHQQKAKKNASVM